ncbi:hypothetical protein KSS87_023523 [Heliosperma pusillum]|nr:hypothetical protein KSS87_023523 [Heliosperma pusillum]
MYSCAGNLHRRRVMKVLMLSTISFREKVDMNALRQLGDSDLKDLGIPMGPRKKILQAVMPRARRQL